MLDLKDINNDWTLFLDRDGVINHDKPDDYVYNVDEFVFYDGVLEALRFFNGAFRHIVMVTNQRGVGRGLMTEADLSAIHSYMMAEIEKAGGRIDKIYYSIANDNNNPDRKPNPGMAYKAQRDFPDIDLNKAIVAGNNMSDMEFGRNAGVHTVFIKSTIANPELPNAAIDMAFETLADLAKALQER